MSLLDLSQARGIVITPRIEKLVAMTSLVELVSWIHRDCSAFHFLAWMSTGQSICSQK